MLLKRYKYQLVTPKCDPFTETLNALVIFSDDIQEVMPYLNAIFKGTNYNQEVGTLTLRAHGKTITLYPRQAAITKIVDDEDARKTLEWLKEIINQTWENRNNIQPSYKRGHELKILEIYKLLPKTNCQQCGEPTCMAFASKLITEDTEITRCSPLFQSIYQKNREVLIATLSEAGYSVPSNSY